MFTFAFATGIESSAPTVNGVRVDQMEKCRFYEHWRTGGRPIVLSNVAVRQEGLTRYSKWRAITELQTHDGQRRRCRIGDDVAEHAELAQSLGP